MRQVRCFIATSLDGFIAGPNDELDWLFQGGDYGYAEFMAGIDTVLLGRRTWEAVRQMEPWPYAGLRTLVLTGRPQAPDPTCEFTAEPPERLVAALRAQPGKDLYLVGGGLLVRDFLRKGLLDELIVSVHPLVLGAGLPLFPPGTPRTPLRLAGTHAWPDGLVTLTYRIGAS